MTTDDVASRVEGRVRTVLLSVSIICAILPTAIILFAIDAQNKSAALSHDKTVVQAAAGELDGSLRAVQRQLESTASFLTLNANESGTVGSLMDAVRSSNHDLLRIVYLDTAGNIVASSGETTVPVLIRPISGDPTFHLRGTLAYVVLSAQPMGAAGGTLLAALSMEGQRERIDELAAHSGGSAFLISSSGESLISPTGAPTPALLHAVDAGKRVFADSAGGRICLVTAATVAGTGWKLVLSHPAPRILSLRLPLMLAAGAAFFAILMGAAFLIVLRRTSLEPARRRIEHLSSTSRSLENTVRQTEMLLRETHHRVKNDLQIVSSMLGLSDRPGLDRSDHAVLVESRNRVHAISLIHELLYKSEDLTGVGIRGYIAELVSRIEGSLMHDGVSIVSRVGDYYFATETCVACGLLLNELLTNSLKHAFPGGEAGVILIRIDRVEQDRFLLEVQDDGIGISLDRATTGSSSLGLRLVRSLTEQLGGTLSVESEEGTTWRIEFTAGEVAVRA